MVGLAAVRVCDWDWSFLFVVVVRAVRAILWGVPIETNRPGSRAASDGQATAPSDLVVIQAGSRSKPPLFCVHAEAGHVLLYDALARHLPRDQPVYGLRAPAPDGRGNDAGFEQMAARHLHSMRVVHPGGPYLIAGECTGGGLAYEIAQQLFAAGEEVAVLALVDAFRPGLPRLQRFPPLPAYNAIHRVRILGFHIGNMFRRDTEHKLTYVTSRAKRACRSVVARASVALRASAAGVSQPQAFKRALAAYEPAPYTGLTVLFRASRLPLGIQAAPDLGWGSVVENLEIEIIPGYFTTPISEPGVRILADRLTSYLRE